MNALVEHLYTTDENRRYVVERVHWIIEMKEPDETWLCVAWQHEKVPLSWLQVTGKDEKGNDVYSFAEQQKWLHRSDVLELREKGHVWVEREEDNGEYPPFFLIVDEVTNERIPGFPIEIEEGELEQRRLDQEDFEAAEQVNKELEKNTVVEPEPLSFLDRDDMPADFFDENGLAARQEEDRIRAGDMAVFDVILSSAATRSARVLADEKIVRDAMAADFEGATKTAALEKTFSEQAAERLKSVLNNEEQRGRWKVTAWVALEGPESAKVRCVATCLCGASISLLPRDGESFKFNVVGDGSAVVNAEAVGFRIGNVSKHVSVCKFVGVPGAEAEPKRRKSTRSVQGAVVLSAAEIRVAVITEYSPYLFRRCSVDFWQL